MAKLPDQVASADTAPIIPTSSSIYLAAEMLKDQAGEAFLDYENDGDLIVLRDNTVALIERAVRLRSAIEGVVDALVTHL